VAGDLVALDGFNSRFLHYGAKDAAFGRNDGVWGFRERKNMQPQKPTGRFLHYGGKDAASGRNDAGLGVGRIGG
jgi:hypothetical protein